MFDLKDLLKFLPKEMQGKSKVAAKKNGGRKSLKIAVATNDAGIKIATRYVEAGKERGHDMQMINFNDCSMHIDHEKPWVYYKGGRISGFDAVIPVVEGGELIYFGTALIRQFEMAGTYVLNRADAIINACDKLCSHQLLSKEGMRMPETWFVGNPQYVPTVLEQMGKGPYVAKLLEGALGKGVMLLEGKQAATGTLETFMSLKVDLLLQEFIKESNGSDIRCFVVGDKVVASMIRKAKEGDFRANVTLGGTAEKIEITKEEREMSIKAAQVVGLSVSGIDLLRSDKGPMVLEVNATPGLKGIEAASGVNVAGEVIKYIEGKVQ